MNIIKTKENNGIKVTVKATKKYIDVTSYADGWNVKTGKELYENTVVRIEKDGKKAETSKSLIYKLNEKDRIKKEKPHFYARFGTYYISEEAYNLIKSVLKEVEEEMNEKFGEATEKKKYTHSKEKKHFGWCDKCHSYCYGDCEA